VRAILPLAALLSLPAMSATIDIELAHPAGAESALVEYGTCGADGKLAVIAGTQAVSASETAVALEGVERVATCLRIHWTFANGDVSAPVYAVVQP
jgi:hypothetical protein